MDSEQQALGLLSGEYDRFSGLYCDSERILTSRGNESTSQVVQIVFHRPANGFAPEDWFPMHGNLFIQERGNVSLSLEETIAAAVQTPLLHAAAELTYDDVTNLAWQFCAMLAFLLILPLVALCWLCMRYSKHRRARICARRCCCVPWKQVSLLEQAPVLEPAARIWFRRPRVEPSESSVHKHVRFDTGKDDL